MIDYDPHDWSSHLLDIRGSMLREITGRILACVLWAAIVTAVHTYAFPLDISPIVHTWVTPALALLLVFRTNASYDRFWEGRRMWGGIINETRNLARLATASLGSAIELRNRAVRWTICFAYAGMHHLRGQKDLGPCSAELPENDVRRVLSSDHVPLAASVEISKQWLAARERGVISDHVVIALDQNVQLLIDYLGSCERIHKTPLPFAYMVHLRRAILLYSYSLPFALLKDFGWLTPLCTLFVAYVLVGIEEIGVEIEDPFGDDDNDLPLPVFCATIERNLNSLIDDN